MKRPTEEEARKAFADCGYHCTLWVLSNGFEQCKFQNMNDFVTFFEKDHSCICSASSISTDLAFAITMMMLALGW